MTLTAFVPPVSIVVPKLEGVTRLPRYRLLRGEERANYRPAPREKNGARL